MVWKMLAIEENLLQWYWYTIDCISLAQIKGLVNLFAHSFDKTFYLSRKFNNFFHSVERKRKPCALKTHTNCGIIILTHHVDGSRYWQFHKSQLETKEWLRDHRIINQNLCT